MCIKRINKIRLMENSLSVRMNRGYKNDGNLEKNIQFRTRYV